MTDKQLSKHIPNHIVELKNGNHYYIESSRVDEFFKLCNTQKFVKIGDVMINSFEVAHVYPDEQKTGDILKQYPETVRIKVKNRAKEYKANLNKEPTQEHLLKWANEYNQ